MVAEENGQGTEEQKKQQACGHCACACQADDVWQAYGVSGTVYCGRYSRALSIFRDPTHSPLPKLGTVLWSARGAQRIYAKVLHISLELTNPGNGPPRPLRVQFIVLMLHSLPPSFSLIFSFTMLSPSGATQEVPRP